MLPDLRNQTERNLFFTEQVDQKSISELTKSIVIINEDDNDLEKIYSLHGIPFVRKPIKIYIDSYGGMVYQCFGLVGIIEKSLTPIHTIVTGCAMSCGFVILIHGHKRFGYNHSTPLYHQVSSKADGTFQALKEDLQEVERLQDKLEEMVLDRTKIKSNKLRQLRERKIDWFMDAKEALRLSVIDEIL